VEVVYFTIGIFIELVLEFLTIELLFVSII